MVNWTVPVIYLQSEMRSQCWCPPTTQPVGEWDPPQQLHKRADGTPDTAGNVRHLHLGPLNLFFCIWGSARLTSYRPALLQRFWILGIHQTAEVSSSITHVSIHASNTEELKSTEEDETILITVGKLRQWKSPGKMTYSEITTLVPIWPF